MSARLRLSIAAAGLGLAVLLAVGMLLDGAQAQQRACSARGYSAPRPVAKLTAAPISVRQGRTVAFDAKFSTGVNGSPIRAFYFDLDGDGAYETVQPAASARRRFDAVGTSFVRLVVVDACGSASLPATVQVEVLEDSERPAVGLSAKRRISLTKALRRGIRIRAGCDEACRLTATARVSGRTRRSLRLRSTRVGRKTGTLADAGTRRLTVKLSKAARRRIRPRRSVRLTLRVEGRDVAGNEAAKRRRITLRRR